MNIPTEEQIRNRAYELYLSHGDTGRPEEDWLQAERELTQEVENEESSAVVWTGKRENRKNNGDLVGAERSKEFKKGF